MDYLASYLAYALRILKNCDLPCEGITTPGGFGNRVKDKLPFAVFEAVRDVYGSELPHYFKYVSSGDESTEPLLEALRDADSDSPRVCANVPAGTGDWFGGWEGASESQGEKYSNAGASAGRMVELIEQRRPAVMLCHWPGLYCGGNLDGYRDFKQVVLALDKRFKDQTLWMKVSDIGRYWTAKQLTKIQHHGDSVALKAPFGCNDFTLRIPRSKLSSIVLRSDAQSSELRDVSTLPSLNAGKFFCTENACYVCFNLEKGDSRLELA